MSTYVIGDIQGCYKPMKKLLKKVKFNAGKDRLWCVGDVVNRGPDSLDTLRYLTDIDDSIEMVLGNHDLHFLAIHHGCNKGRSKDTLDELLDAKDCDELAEWLRHKPLAHYEAVDTKKGPVNFLMLHAGVAPRWNLQETLNHAAEVEYALQDKHFPEFLENMYGDTPIRWFDKLKGQDRLRTITNYLTRVRFCDDIGSLRLDIKEGFCSAPEGYKPWFEFEKITPKADILFGHWAAIEGQTGHKHIHALDTGYVWGRDLTLMCLEDGKRYAVSAKD